MSNDKSTRFHTFLQEQLNEEQRKAVVCPCGILLVRAAAGSGKTRVITARMVYQMLELHASSQEIVALTFTNKAAREMQERVTHFLPPSLTAPFVGTFHSYCLSLIKQYGSLINLASFTILDSSDREQLLKNLIKKSSLHKKITPNNMGGLISCYKNDITSVIKKQQPNWPDPLYHELFKMYEQERKAARCLDFDDLLVEGVRLLETQPQLRQRLQERIKHILVDEYQDTNRIQNAFIGLLVRNTTDEISIRSLCVVGDEDQSIYSWRGATVDTMMSFSKQFPGAQIITIDQNYRSVQPILQTANKVINNNVTRSPKEIWSQRAAHNRVQCFTTSSSYQEAEFIAHCCARFAKKQALNNVAILYRSHFQSRALEEALIRHSIPYKIIGGTQFYDRLEIKDILAYLRLAVNPYDRISFARCLNTPPRALGDAVHDLFMRYWDENPLLAWHEIVQLIGAQNALPQRKQHTLEALRTLLTDLAQAETAYKAFELVLTRTHFIAYLTESYEVTEARERIANVHELGNALVALESRGITKLAEFLNEVTLLQEHISSEDDEQQYVRLMTLHSAKGLEFHTVIIPGLEESVFPSPHAIYSPTSIEEERRLLYVGITRAREHLLMLYTLTRFIYGKTQEQLPSRFISELPSNLVQQINLTYTAPHAFTTTIATIFGDKHVQTREPVSSKKPSLFF